MCCYINNQNFRISDDSISFPVMINGKSKRISVKTKISKRQRLIFSSSKLGTMRIVVKGHDLVAQIQNIRSTTRTSRKNNHNLHTWSFYRLATFIEYKAKLAGIEVEYVDPAYTSQICPICGSVHHANDRNYTCRCGFHTHRDLLGAINICNSTEYIGNRYTA